jgi:hypothetical protein
VRRGVVKCRCLTTGPRVNGALLQLAAGSLYSLSFYCQTGLTISTELVEIVVGHPVTEHH